MEIAVFYNHFETTIPDRENDGTWKVRCFLLTAMIHISAMHACHFGIYIHSNFHIWKNEILRDIQDGLHDSKMHFAVISTLFSGQHFYIKRAGKMPRIEPWTFESWAWHSINWAIGTCWENYTLAESYCSTRNVLLYINGGSKYCALLALCIHTAVYMVGQKRDCVYTSSFLIGPP